jgi:hypothetical protein
METEFETGTSNSICAWSRQLSSSSSHNLVSTSRGWQGPGKALARHWQGPGKALARPWQGALRRPGAQSSFPEKSASPSACLNVSPNAPPPTAPVLSFPFPSLVFLPRYPVRALKLVTAIRLHSPVTPSALQILFRPSAHFSIKKIQIVKIVQISDRANVLQSISATQRAMT